MADEDDRFVGRIYAGDDGVHVVTQRDATPVGIQRLQPGQGERFDRMSRLLERGDHSVPRGGIEPEAGNEDDLHELTLG